MRLFAVSAKGPSAASPRAKPAVRGVSPKSAAATSAQTRVGTTMNISPAQDQPLRKPAQQGGEAARERAAGEAEAPHDQDDERRAPARRRHLRGEVAAGRVGAEEMPGRGR